MFVCCWQMVTHAHDECERHFTEEHACGNSLTVQGTLAVFFHIPKVCFSNSAKIDELFLFFFLQRWEDMHKSFTCFLTMAETIAVFAYR